MFAVARATGCRAFAVACRHVVVLAGLTTFAACSGGGSTAVPGPTPSATPGPQPAVDSAISLERLAVEALTADAWLALLVRPGESSLLGTDGVAHAPACDAATATATSVTPKPAGNGVVVRTAIYPSGDTTCSQAPEVAIVIGYDAPGASGPQNGYGYAQFFTTAQSYLTANFPSQLALYVVSTPGSPATLQFAPGFDVALGSPQLQPPAGTFPATFPSLFVDQSQSIASQLSSQPFALLSQGFWYATSSSANGLGASWFDPVYAATGQSPNQGDTYGQTDLETFAATAGAAGTSVAATAAAPAYAISRSPVDPVEPLATFPLAAGQTRFTVGTRTSVGESSGNATFGATTNTFTYASDGALLASHQTFVDAASGVSVDLLSTDGLTFTLTATDTIRHVALTSPSPLQLSLGGAPCAFSYTPFAVSATTPLYTDQLNEFTCPAASTAKKRR